MLALLGVNYLTDSITAAYEENRITEAYRCYVTDCIYLISAWTGNAMNHRFYDMLHPQLEDTRTADEIISERLERFGIKVVE